MIRIRIFATFRGERLEVQSPAWMRRADLLFFVRCLRKEGAKSIYPVRCK